jgi:Tol biopolymer transport system component
MRPPPSAEEWRLLEPLVDAILDALPAERPALLSELSGGDALRRAELERFVSECEREYPLLDEAGASRFAAVLGEEAPLVPETLAGRYRVRREAGRGGMAIVYLAQDLRYGRDVAIKVVRPELAATIGRERFLHEIEIAARLRHPHIVPLYDSGEVPEGESGEVGGSLLYYVMPYEVGHSLRERLDRDGPLPVGDVVLVLRDVCEALAHAHSHGIVHRDIKPDNVLLSGGHALVTDFGVARAVTEAASEINAVTGSTGFGTPTYMAPEQASGGAHVDHRADIYAVGVLAYELLAGRPPLAGDDRFRTRPADVARELTRVRADVSGELVSLVAKCLARRPQDRWQSADDLLAELAAIGTATAPRPVAWKQRSPTRVAAAGIALIGVGSLLALASVRARGRRAPATLEVGRATQLTSVRGLEVQPAISPDGRYVAFAAGHSLNTRIAVKPVGGGQTRWLTSDSTANQWLPSWSPKGGRVLFLSGGGVFSAQASGGAVRAEIAARPEAIVRSAAWSPDGREIAYVRGDSLLARSVASGVTRLVTRGSDLHSCRWSPDGVWLACVSGNSFYVTVGAVSGVGPMFGNLAPSRIVLVPAAGGLVASLTDGATLNQGPVWSRDGQTLYYVSNREGPRDIYALDLRDLRSRGPAPSSREPARVTTGLGAQSIDVSADGAHLVYAAYSSTANVWSMSIPAHSRTTPMLATASSARQVTSRNQTVEGLRVSPDGRWLVYDSDLSGNSDIYRVPITGGEPERLTHGPADAFRGTISPNGRELAYHSFQTGSRNLYLITLNGRSVRQLTRSSGQLAMANWSPDGAALAFFDMIGTRVMVMRRDAQGRWGEPRFAGGRGWRAEWAPDGRTIAFVSPTDGRIGLVPADSGAPRDIYVPSRGDPLAELAVFASSGREIYFKSHDSQGRASFWSIPVTGGRPRLLVRFDDPSWSSNRFDFATDNRRFYFTVEDRQSDVWIADIARR